MNSGTERKVSKEEIIVRPGERNIEWVLDDEEKKRQEPIGRIHRFIKRDWFVSMEEAEFWYRLLLLPTPGQDSAMQLGLEE